MGANNINPERSRIGNRLKELRLAAGITTYQLAEKSGVTRTNISRIENGKYSAGLDVLSKLAQALGKSLDFV